jgi:acetyl-CoA carboxylase biotin carboxyl carrier protein
VAFELFNIKRVLDAFERGEWGRIHLSDGESELLLSVEEEPEGASRNVSVADTTGRQPAAAQIDTSEPESDAGPVPVASLAPPPLPSATENGTVVVASSMGIFWRSPSPGAPPFVSVGDIVTHDTTMCIIEVMKLMHRISAGVHGVVVAVLLEDSQEVVAGQPLFIVEPVAAQSA